MRDIFVFFFFSSRRRHTRYWRDWSSDVCSSDLTMPDTEKSPPATQNRLLAALPSREYERLAPYMQTVSFEQGQSLYEANDPIEYAYFSLTGVTSMIITTLDGATVEIGLVGREGFVGYQPLLGMKSAPNGA